MADYIEREKVLSKAVPVVGCFSNMISAYDVIMLPAADVAPVVHGRWIEQERYTFGVMYDCSICGDRILDNGHSWNYCSNCGAKMDGGSD